jgi:murein DD-endopeptidase MepM/ murein hydrolase activator NlpD
LTTKRIPKFAQIFWAALLLSAHVFVPPLQAQGGGPEYVVQEGDTLFSIALAFGVSVEKLQTANNITDPSLLSIGQALIIPGFDDVSGRLTTHRLQPGETLSGLSKRLGVPADTLIRLNRIVNPAMMYVGQSVIQTEGEAGLSAGVTAVMKKNESLAALAARTGQTVWGLTLINDLDSPVEGYAGKEIILPADPAAGPPLTGLPQPFTSLSLRPDRPIQGGTLEVKVQTVEGITFVGHFVEWPLRFSVTPEGQAALQGIHVFTEPALYPLTLTATMADGSTTVFEQMVPVASGNYPSQQLFVGVEDSALLDPSIVGPEREQVNQIVSAYTESKQWQGLFLKPVQSDRITTGFGWRRSYNGGPFESYHDGLDYGVSGGSSIIAPAAGTVVFAGPLTVRGNATIIDHGRGVYTGYWHQYRIKVEVGQTVQAGDVIGEVGSSGLSTGSHLHFAMWVGGVPVNPQQWLDQEFP